MAHPRKYAFAFAAVVQRIFLEGLCQPVTSGGPNRRNGNVGTESLAVTFEPLVPLRWGIGQLVDARREPGADNRIRTIRIEKVIADLCSLRRTNVCQVQLACGCDWRGVRRVPRIR